MVPGPFFVVVFFFYCVTRKGGWKRRLTSNLREWRPASRDMSHTLTPPARPAAETQANESWQRRRGAGACQGMPLSVPRLRCKAGT